MPNNASDRDCPTFKLPFEREYEPNKHVLGLSDISPKNKTWDKHRANADIVADYYAVGAKLALARYDLSKNDRGSIMSQAITKNINLQDVLNSARQECILKALLLASQI